MKNLKAHHHLVIASLLIFGMVGVWTWGTVVFASSAGTTVSVQVGPPDVCTNIAGYQETVPAGMEVDGSGNCYTPPIDVCNNLTGVQTVIPSGYYQDSNGDCYEQPKPPVDVCSNIPGLQLVVPTGFVSTEDGRCVLPPNDMCDNIPGLQALIPEGMQRGETGVCFTPGPIETPTTPSSPAPENPWVAPVQPREPAVTAGTPRYKNIPVALAPVVAPLVDAIPENVKEALRSVPPVVAQTFPYYTFGVLAVAAAVMGAQTVREVAATRKLVALTKRERAVAEEKDNFVALASHYLRTPLTIMKGALDTSLATKERTQDELLPLRTSLDELDSQIATVLADVDENRALKKIKAPEPEAEAKQHFLRSPFFWVPVGSTIAVVWVSNFLLGVVGDVELGTFNLMAQAAIFFAVSVMFYSAIRTRYIKVREKSFHEKLLKHEEAIDIARNDFIGRATLALTTGLAHITQNREIIAGGMAESFFNEGYTRFENLLKKFTLLSEIQAGVVGATEKFDISTAITDIITHYQAQLDAKHITVVNNIKNSPISQRRSLFDFVLGSLIDNAIKFSNEGGTITVSSTPHERSLTVRISDYGENIPEEKMSQLFKPFSRGTSAMEFNYEGLGFSLFLDKIIMDYVGGNITASSIPNQSTTFSVTTNTY